MIIHGAVCVCLSMYPSRCMCTAVHNCIDHTIIYNSLNTPARLMDAVVAVLGKVRAYIFISL